MKIITTKVHGFLDYPWGILLIASPWIFGFDDAGQAAKMVPIVLGILMLAGSLMTDYELGAVRVFSMRTHLVIDMLSALFLIASPWLFGFSDRVYQPHVIIGAIQLVLALLTSKQPGPSRTTVHFK
jgi:hypothetical protein